MTALGTATDPALFPKRAAKSLGNAALHQLVADMAAAMALQARDVAEIKDGVLEIKDMCLKIMGRLA
jgi:hypothetical protein